MSKIEINTRQVDGVVILAPAGPITLGESSEQLRDAVKAHVAEGKRSLLIDLSSVTKIDSSGLGTLVACYATLQNNDGKLKLTKPTEKATELMTVTKLYTLFEVFDTEREAVESFGTQPEHPTQPLDEETASAARPNSVL